MENFAENEFIPQSCAIFATITRHVDLLVFCSCLAALSPHLAQSWMGCLVLPCFAIHVDMLRTIHLFFNCRVSKIGNDIPSGHSTGSYDFLCKITVKNEFLYIICQLKKAIASAWLGSTTGTKHIIMKDPHSVTFFSPNPHLLLWNEAIEEHWAEHSWAFNSFSRSPEARRRPGGGPESLATSLFYRALGIMVFIWGIIPFYGLKIQLSEILSLTQIDIPSGYLT